MAHVMDFQPMGTLVLFETEGNAVLIGPGGLPCVALSMRELARAAHVVMNQRGETHGHGPRAS